MPEHMIIDNPQPVTFTIEQEARTIRGLLIPFGDIATSRGKRWTFSKGTLTWRKPKALDGHDWTRAFGLAALTEDDRGVWLTAKAAPGPRGDEVLQLAAAGVYDGLSAGLGPNVQAVLKDGVYHVTHAEIIEASVTPMPAFERAAITSVAASAVQNRKEPVMGDENETPEAPQLELGPMLDALNGINDKLAAFAAIPPREPNPTAQLGVVEELPYRFDGFGGEHGFMSDIIAAHQANPEAKQRLETFLGEVFANEQTPEDVAALNPTVNRPELYVPALHYGRPLWNLVTTGGLDSITSFTIPKFKQATGTKPGQHTTGAEPGNMKIETEVQTVTPTPQSGLAIVRREVVDQGGNPNVDQIIWNEMISAYFEGMETSLATLLATGTGTLINISGGASDPAKIKLLTAAISRFQFVKGGDRFASFAGDPSLYELATSAQDSTGRPLFPILGGTNADGSKRASLESVQIGSKAITPAWALAKEAPADNRSYLFVPGSVYGWLSAPRRIDIEYEVANVRIGLWGYKATACVRNTDIVTVRTVA